MKSIVKLFGVTSCCLVGSVTAANAEPTVLADAELDRVAAGSCAVDLGNCDGFNDTPGAFGIFPLRFPPLFPSTPTDGPIPVEGPGCNTGGGPCDPSPLPVPIFGPIAFPSIGPFIPFWPPPGQYCGPACDPGPVAFLAGP